MKMVNEEIHVHSVNQRSCEWYEGYQKLRLTSKSESKLGIPDSMSCADFQIQEVKKLAEKIKWMSYFKRAYPAEVLKIKNSKYDPIVSRIFIIKLGKKELGCIRIVNKTYIYDGLEVGEVWGISEVYVKPPYRSQGICSKLMNYVLKNNNVKSILLEVDRYEKNKYYFNRFGLSSGVDLGNGLARYYLNDFYEEILKKTLSTEVLQ